MASKRKYGVLEASPEPTRYELRERTAQGKVVRVTGRFLPSLQDPFHVLGDHEVREIITHLEARDTETLRRVSRLWKASAEYHCERSLLLQHFPWMATKICQSTTREELNLLFRRCLYQQESLKAGLATRAIKFSGARECHIRDDRIVWSNLAESISTRLLRSSKASSSRNSGMKRLDIKKLIPRHWHVKLIQAASTDTILVTAEVDPNFGPSIPNAHKLILVSLSGTVKWIADVENPFSRPAIGKASLYLIYYRMATAFADDQDSKVVLMKLSLSTGAVEMDKDLSIADKTYGLRPATFFGDESLVLSMDETYAMWVNRYIVTLPPGITASHHIICTTTGSLLYRYENSHLPLTYTATSSIAQNALWVYRYPHAWLTSQNPHDKSWATRSIRLPGPNHPYVPREPKTTVQLGFEGDRLLFSHLIHFKPTEIERQERFWSSGNSTRMRTSNFGVSSATREVKMGYAPSMPSIVTLPDGNGGRRILEVKLPWADDAVSFFGFVWDFIAYHVRRDQVLLLIDFWPDW